MAKKNELSGDTILEAEFEYIEATATQANEDRSKVASFYFVSVGSLIAAIFSAQLFDADQNGEVLQKGYLAFCALWLPDHPRLPNHRPSLRACAPLGWIGQSDEYNQELLHQ